MGRERSSPKANLTLFSAGRGGEAGFCRFKAARNGGSRVKGLISCLLTPGHLLSTKTIRKGIRGMFSGLPQQPSWHLFLLFWFRFCYETRKQNSSETVGRQLPSRWRLRREMSGAPFFMMAKVFALSPCSDKYHRYSWFENEGRVDPTDYWQILLRLRRINEVARRVSHSSIRWWPIRSAVPDLSICFSPTFYLEFDL